MATAQLKPIYIEPHVHKRLRILAALEDKQMKEVVAGLVPFVDKKIESHASANSAAFRAAQRKSN